MSLSHCNRLRDSIMRLSNPTMLLPPLRVIASRLIVVLFVITGCSDTVTDSLTISDDAPRSTDFDVDKEAVKEQRQIFVEEPEKDVDVPSSDPSQK